MRLLGISLIVIAASLALYVATKELIINNDHTARKVLKEEGQTLNCYEKPDCDWLNGDFIYIGVGRNVPDLKLGPFSSPGVHLDDRIASCKYDGIYLLYDGRDYNKDNLKV